jgi:mlo protein
MEDASLEHTPTWVVAAVCFTIVSVSLAAERFLHYLGKARAPFQPPPPPAHLFRLLAQLLLQTKFSMRSCARASWPSY